MFNSVDDIRKAWGSEWADAPDDEVIRAYAKGTGWDPSYVATLLGTTYAPVVATIQVPKSFPERIADKAIGGAVLGGSVVIFIIFIGFAWRLSRKAKTALGNTARASVNAVASMGTNAKLSNVHVESTGYDDFYETALNELDRGELDKATWARALVASDGDESRARAYYIKMRVAKRSPEVPTVKNSDKVG
jgi:hypothetical protein